MHDNYSAGSTRKITTAYLGLVGHREMTSLITSIIEMSINTSGSRHFRVVIRWVTSRLEASTTVSVSLLEER